jgi:hypothetical protein
MTTSSLTALVRNLRLSADWNHNSPSPRHKMTEQGDDGASSLIGIGAQASSALVGPVLLGIILDWQLGWTPYATLAGIGLGMFGMMSLLIRFMKRSRE